VFIGNVALLAIGGALNGPLDISIFRKTMRFSPNIRRNPKTPASNKSAFNANSVNTGVSQYKTSLARAL